MAVLVKAHHGQYSWVDDDDSYDSPADFFAGNGKVEVYDLYAGKIFVKKSYPWFWDFKPVFSPDERLLLMGPGPLTSS